MGESNSESNTFYDDNLTEENQIQNDGNSKIMPYQKFLSESQKNSNLKTYQLKQRQMSTLTK